MTDQDIQSVLETTARVRREDKAVMARCAYLINTNVARELKMARLYPARPRSLWLAHLRSLRVWLADKVFGGRKRGP